MKKILLSAIAALALGTSAQADFLGAEVGYAAWSPSLSGSIKGKEVGDLDLNLKDSLGYGNNERNSFAWVYFDHFIPLVPNIKIQQTKYTDSASKTTSVTYDAHSYTGSVASSLTLDQTDFIAYYRILDNWVNLDLGLNVKYINGNISISDSTATVNTNKDFKAYVPMAYAKARFDLPFTGLSIEADGSYIGYSGSKFTDMKAGIVYETSFGLGITAGYRALNLTLDDIDSTNTNIDIKGAYAGLFYHF